MPSRRSIHPLGEASPTSSPVPAALRQPDSNLRPQITPSTTKSSAPDPALLPDPGSPVNIFRILSLTAVAMAALLAFLPAAGHDQLWCLYVARHMLSGAPLYGPELLESNPPLIFWLLLLPVRLAALTHLPSTVLFKLAVVLLELASALASLHLLRRLCPSLPRADLWFLLFAFLTVFAVVPARDLGQRDHLLALLCLPYVVSTALDLSEANKTRTGPPSRPSAPAASPATSQAAPPPASVSPHSTQNTGLRNVRFQDISTPNHAQLPHPQTSAARPFIPLSAQILLGISAGVGLALKPHHLLIPLALELALILRARSLRPLRRPAPWAILLTALAYLAAIRLLTPAYLTTILPILRDTYWAIGHLTPLELLAQSPQLHLLLAVTLTLSIINRRQPAPTPHTLSPSDPGTLPNLRTLADTLLLAGLASTVAYYLQGTGWYYQQLPAISFATLSLALHLILLAARHPVPIPRWLPAATAALSLLAIGLTMHFSGFPFSTHAFSEDHTFPITSPDPTFFANLPPNTPVAILSTAVDDTVPPLFRFHLLWAQRTNNLWILPAILRNEDPQNGSGQPRSPYHIIPPGRLAALDRDQHRFMVEDLNRWHPRLILIARCQDLTVHCQVLEDRHDNLLAWFRRDPAFEAAFSHFHYLRSSGIYDAYIPN